jgi:hypothetical protein
MLYDDEPRTTDVCAILTLVFGAVSLLLLGLSGFLFGVPSAVLAVAALCLGITALYRRALNRRLNGMPLAVLGLVLSLPALFIVGAYFQRQIAERLSPPEEVIVTAPAANRNNQGSPYALPPATKSGFTPLPPTNGLPLTPAK